MIKKEIPIRMNLACIPIRRKEYKGYGMLFYFMLEEHTEMGSVPVIKFARSALDIDSLISVVLIAMMLMSFGLI